MLNAPNPILLILLTEEILHHPPRILGIALVEGSKSRRMPSINSVPCCGWRSLWPRPILLFAMARQHPPSISTLYSWPMLQHPHVPHVKFRVHWSRSASNRGSSNSAKSVAAQPLQLSDPTPYLRNPRPASPNPNPEILPVTPTTYSVADHPPF